MIIGDLVDDGYAEIRTGPFGTQLRASEYVKRGRPVLNVRNVGFGDVRGDKLEYVDEATAARLSGHVLREGDIVFGRKGAVERHAFIGSAYEGALQGSDCIRLRLAAESPVRAAFLTFALRTREHQAWMQSFCSHGATMASLNQDILRQVPLPDLDRAQQDLAITILQTADDLIEKNRRRVEVLEDMARAIYREWFVHFRYPGHGNATFVDSSLGRVPDGWTVMAACDALWINPRMKLGRSEHPFITMGDLSERSLICLPSESKPGTSGAKFQNGDTLFARITPCLENGKTGYVQCLSDGQVGRGSTELIVLRGRTVGAAFTYCLARSEQFRRHAIQSMSGASGRQRVRDECFGAYWLAVPPRSLADRFEDAARPLFRAAHALTLQAVQLGSLRDLLLPKLVSGQIDVSSLDLDRLVEGSAA